MSSTESTSALVEHPTFHRDPLTKLLYGLHAYMGFLFVAPAVFLPRLRDELGLGYGVTAAHIAVSAAGSMVAAALLPRLERAFTRRTLIWCGVAGTAVGELLLTVAHHPAVSIGAMAVIGLSFAPVVAMLAAVLADVHGENRAIAITEGSMFGAGGSVLTPVLVGGIAALVPAVGWRGALAMGAAFGLALPIALRHRTFVDGGTLGEERAASLPKAVHLRSFLLFASVTVEICVTFLGPTYLRDSVGFSQGAAASLSAVFLIAVVAGRAAGSRLSRRVSTPRLLAVSFLVTSVGFTALWATTSQVPAAIGYAVVGLGVANFFPLGLSLVAAAAPDRSGAAISRCMLVSSVAALSGPLALGALADATDIRIAFGIVAVALAAAMAALAMITRPDRAAPVVGTATPR